MKTNETSIDYPVNVSGFSTIQRFTSKHMVQKGDCYEAINIDLFTNMGIAAGVLGYTATYGVAATPRGLFGHISFAAAGNRLGIGIKKAGTTISYNSGAGWFNSNKTAQGTGTLRCVSFLDNIYATDETSGLIYRSTNAQTYTDIAAPAAVSYSFIETYATRVFIATGTQLNWSSLPSGGTITFPTNFFVQPETNNGDYITGLKRLRKRLLVLRRFSLLRFIQYSDTQFDLMPISEEIGVFNNEAIQTYEGIAYFYGGTKDGEDGIFMTDGERVQLISRQVQDIIRGRVSTDVNTVVTGVKNGCVKFFIGDVLLDSGLKTERTITNVELIYSIRDNAWGMRSLAHVVYRYAPMSFGAGESTRDLYFLDSAGQLYRDEVGSDYGGNEIFPELTTHFLLPADIDKNVVTKEIYITGLNLQGIIVQIRSDINLDEWVNVKNDLDRSTLFKGGVEVLGSQFQIKIVGKNRNIAIEKIKMTFDTEINEIIK